MLTLLSHIYRCIWVARKWLYDSGLLRTRRLPCPVICVGNLTTGGTGKTPAVIAIARILHDMDTPLAVLSRGYKRKSKSPVLVVSNGKSILAAPEESGDEPYLIASTLKGVPVIVGADRYRSGIYSISDSGENIFILDDGYQHLKLHRDINILLIDASNPFGNGHLLPKGILREPISGISRADCVILTRANEAGRTDVDLVIRKHNRTASVFHASYTVTDITGTDGNSYGINAIKGRKVFIFSGIANPQSFRKSIEHAGGIVCGELSYPDHYWYKDDDLTKIKKDASAVQADAIVTTAKDAVRLHVEDMRDMTVKGIKLLILHVEMTIEREFSDWIKQAIMQSFSDEPS